MRYEAHVRELEGEISIEEAINQEVPRMRLDPGKGVVAAFEDPSTLKILPPQNPSIRRVGERGRRAAASVRVVLQSAAPAACEHPQGSPVVLIHASRSR